MPRIAQRYCYAVDVAQQSASMTWFHLKAILIYIGVVVAANQYRSAMARYVGLHKEVDVYY